MTRCRRLLVAACLLVSWPHVAPIIQQGLPEQYLGKPAYFGASWEDPVTKLLVYQAVPVTVDPVSALVISSNDLTDDFDWRRFEAGTHPALELTTHTASSHVRGVEGFEPQPLQSWEARNDAVQHGHFMLYQFDDTVTELNGNMTDYFFAITFDAHVHPDYEASPGSNSSVRFTLYESLPADLGSTDATLAMANEFSVAQAELTGGNEWDVHTQRHRLTWGFGNGGSGALTANCTAPVTSLYIGVQCLQGYEFPTGECTPDVMAPPALDDCKSYCPYTLTVRAIKRQLQNGDSEPTYLGPGQWQAFEVHGLDKVRVID